MKIVTTEHRKTHPRIQVIQSAAEMSRFKGLWDELAARRSIFQSFAWSQAAAWQFGAREKPYVIVAKGEGGVAIIPAVVRSSELSLLGEALFDYRDVLCSGEAEFLDAAWRELASLSMPMQVTAVRSDDRAANWRSLGLTDFATAPGIRRSEMGADELTAKHRKLGRLARRLRRQGVTLRRHSGMDRALVRHIYHAKSTQANGSASLFVDPLRREFMETVCGLDPGCEIFTYEDGVALVAALVTFRERTVRRFYTIYFDWKYANESPGQVLLFEVARLTLDEGFDCDFMTGSFPYKDRLATCQIPLYRVSASVEMLQKRAFEQASRVA